jgi:hypothetical protein
MRAKVGVTPGGLGTETSVWIKRTGEGLGLTLKGNDGDLPSFVELPVLTQDAVPATAQNVPYIWVTNTVYLTVNVGGTQRGCILEAL